MRVPSFMTLACILFAAGAALLIFILTHKSPVVATAAPKVSAYEDEHKLSKYIAEVELKNELERDRIEQERKLARQAKAKKDSLECQFWMQQKAKSSTKNRKTEEKIAQFCELEGTITAL
ncbi:hypothetical protein GCM10011613_00380 [Cellvibrio zantedeschiae]|uniref:Uncharacterized protein n=1 Tax=Cellvibrio zantedeschiae TaxID=1237077 RepID=A0ABQ3AP07_9GAMM|nr:hypothetical protein [Cellvibrio zantedeschiae]GGY60981.1 hypothetical protein GCM10011613_00380 [Cellvibrio zantedeschiae]